MLVKPLKQQIKHCWCRRIIVVNQEFVDIMDKDGVWSIDLAISHCHSICYSLESFFDVKIWSIVQALTDAFCTHFSVNKQLQAFF